MQKEIIPIGGDHAGYELKEYLIKYLMNKGFETKDFGTHSKDSVDYPDFVHPLAKAVDSKEYSRGILVCGSANGVAMTANKYQNVRAAIVWDKEITKLSRQHNDANILCLPARFISEVQSIEFVDLFLETEFEGGRHERRVKKIGCA